MSWIKLGQNAFLNSLLAALTGLKILMYQNWGILNGKCIWVKLWAIVFHSSWSVSCFVYVMTLVFLCLRQVRYDNELKRYMKATGLRAKDLRAMAKSQPRVRNRSRSSSNQSASSSTSGSNQQLAAQAAAFMGLPITAGVPVGMLGAAAGAMSMLPPHFTQVFFIKCVFNSTIVAFLCSIVIFRIFLRFHQEYAEQSQKLMLFCVLQKVT